MEDTNGQSPATTAPVTGGQPVAAAGTQEQGQVPVQQTTQPVHQQPVESQPQQSPPDVSRYVSQINGMKGMVEPLNAAGITSADQIQTMLQKSQQFDSLASKGINVDAMLQGAAQQQSQENPGEQPLTLSGIEQMFDTREATAAHKSGFSALNNKLNGIVAEFSDESSRPILNSLMQQVMTEQYGSNGLQYPAGHPRAGQTMPLADNHLDDVRAKFVAKIDEARGMFARQQATPNQTVTPGQNGSLQAQPGGQPAKEQTHQEATRSHITGIYEKHHASLQQ